jgi:hypothetical protein
MQPFLSDVLDAAHAEVIGVLLCHGLGEQKAAVFRGGLLREWPQ